MTFRIYIVPTVSPIFNGKPWRVVKYFGDNWLASKFGSTVAAEAGLENIASSRNYYGAHPVAIVVADVTPAQHAILNAHADILVVPSNLDATLSASAVTTTKNFLESLHIPAGWISTSLTFRAVIRKVLWLFMYVQAIQQHYNFPLAGGSTGFTLGTQFSSFPVEQQNAMILGASILGFSSAGLQPTTTLRTILKNLADQFGDVAFETIGFSI